MSINTNKTAYVGLSGGVDSSVSAALLKDQGYNVVGVFIRTWQPDFIECTWRDDKRDAIRVAAHLGIPFRELDLEKEYKHHVADYMINEYKAGRTPNPDIMCNREIKFGAFASWALKEGADFVATGHYAQITKNKEEYLLSMGKDPNKDQTYFLWTLVQEDLKHILFPIGHLEKKDVRKLAEKFGLPTAAKKDSQGICMLGDIDLKEFLKEFIDAAPGAVLDEQGNAIGSHSGSVLFTLGERHGFTVTAKKAIGKVFYVIAKDVNANTITVSENPLQSVLAHEKLEIGVAQTSWVSGAPPLGKKVTARSRYRAPLGACEIVVDQKGNMLVRFEKPEIAASSGQSIVVYDGEACLGGGIIA